MRDDAVPFGKIREEYMTASLVILNGYTIKDRWHEEEADVKRIEPTDRFTYRWYKDIKVLVMVYQGNVKNKHKSISHLLKGF